MLGMLIPVLGPLLETVLKRLIPDPEARQKAIAELYAGLQASDLAQMDVNKTEAASRSVFVAGWRPAVGWTCAFALFYQYVLCPVGMWISYASGYPLPNPPSLDGQLMELLMGMLGMGALRTFEKLKGVTS
jgi:hypothetical protein